MNATERTNHRELSRLLAVQPPSDLDAEASLIASILLDPHTIEMIDGKIRDRDFYDDANRIVFRMLVTMHEADEPAGDVRLVVANLRQSGELEKIGGAGYFSKVVGAVATPSSAGHFAEIVAEASRKRTLISMCSEALSRSYDPTDSSLKIAEWVEAKISALGVTDDADVISLRKATQSLVSRIQEAKRTEQKIGLPTGIPCLDEDLGGLFQGDLVIIAARPSIGKTSLGIQFAKHVATKGHRALFVSLEMQEWELAGRLASAELDVNFRRLRNADVDNETLANIQAYACGLDGFPFHLWRPKRVNIEKIRAKAKMMAATVGLDFIAIDYLTKISPSDSRMQRHEQIEHIVGAAKNIAKELNVPVAMLAQAKRTDKNRRPRLDDLFGSSMIEADADVVMMLHREDRNSEEAIIGIEKNRNGATGDLRLGYRCARTEFYDASYEGAEF